MLAWYHVRKVLGGLYCCVKFSCIQQCSFVDMLVSVLCVFGLKMPVPAPFWSVFGDINEGNGKSLQFNPSKNQITRD